MSDHSKPITVTIFGWTGEVCESCEDQWPCETFRLRSECARLTRERDEAERTLAGIQQEADSQREARAAAESSLAAARDVLREVEWHGPVQNGPFGYLACPDCERTKDKGHAPDCTLAAALGGSHDVANSQVR